MVANLLIYGGSFDPLHNGHLNTALEVQKHIQFERFIFLPCKTPVLKKATTASCEQRIQMLELGLKPYPAFEIDLREILRDTPSFMVDTLHSFREEVCEPASITLLMGLDAFLSLPKWHAWEKILTLCHLFVMKRTQTAVQTIPEELKTLLAIHEVFDKAELLNEPFGKIYQFNAGEYLISSTMIRQKISEGKTVSNFLPESVSQYIITHKPYN